MCMEDVQIGRLAYREEKIVAIADTPTPLVGEDASRYSLWLQNIGAAVVTVGFKGDVAAGLGMRLEITGKPEKFHLVRDGRMVTDGLTAICAAAASSTVLVWATYMAKEKSLRE